MSLRDNPLEAGNFANLGEPKFIVISNKNGEPRHEVYGNANLPAQYKETFAALNQASN